MRYGKTIPITSIEGVRCYIVGSLSSASDDTYFEPAALCLGGKDKFFGLLYVTYYVPLGDKGINQWLVDPLELQYALLGPLAVGFSGYYYRPHDGEALHKLGGKLSYAYRYGSFDLAVRGVNRNRGVELQLRTIVAF